jgi:hypothetical protein
MTIIPVAFNFEKTTMYTDYLYSNIAFMSVNLPISLLRSIQVHEVIYYIFS